MLISVIAIEVADVEHSLLLPLLCAEVKVPALEICQLPDAAAERIWSLIVSVFVRDQISLVVQVTNRLCLAVLRMTLLLIDTHVLEDLVLGWFLVRSLGWHVWCTWLLLSQYD